MSNLEAEPAYRLGQLSEAVRYYLEILDSGGDTTFALGRLRQVSAADRQQAEAALARARLA